MIRKRVFKARQLQSNRFQGDKLNSQMGRKDLESWAWPDRETNEWLFQAASQMGLSARSYDRVLRVARTIADLAQAPQIRLSHVQEAVQYRNLEKNNAVVP